MVEWILAALNRLNAERGQALAETSLVLALVFAVCVIAVGALGLVIAGNIDSVAAAFS